jgi:DNA-directed RNA polymerase specialized sigma24 family protein
MYAPVSPVRSPAGTPVSVSPLDRTSWQDSPFQPRQPDPFVRLVRNHHRSIFHLAHALLRDEVAAEKITQQVFSRARKRMGRNPASVIEWIYYASLRFVRMYHWRSVGLIARRRMRRTLSSHQPGLDLKTFVQVIAWQPGKIDPRDCELLALRHVLGMPLSTIAQLLRMHPYEVSNRLAWALERVAKLSHQTPAEIEKPVDLALSA